MRATIWIGFAVAVSLVWTSPVAGGEGRIPIWKPMTLGPGDEGMYILTRNVTAALGAPVIELLPGVGQVDIDLNGLTLTGLDDDVIRGNDIGSLTVRNGTLLGGLEGIHIQDAREVVVEDVKVRNPASTGITLYSVRAYALRRNIITAETEIGAGIAVDNYGFIDRGVGSIEDNLVQWIWGTGISVFMGRNVDVTGNRVENASYGIDVQSCYACQIVDNTVSFVRYDGIVVGINGGKVTDNAVYYSQGDGIVLVSSYATLVRGNASTSNLRNGLRVRSDANQIEQNVLCDNGESGIWFESAATDNTFGRNTVRRNSALPGPCVFNPPSCLAPDVCNDGINNSSFGDNMGPIPGC